MFDSCTGHVHAQFKFRSAQNIRSRRPFSELSRQHHKGEKPPQHGFGSLKSPHTLSSVTVTRHPDHMTT